MSEDFWKKKVMVVIKLDNETYSVQGYELLMPIGDILVATNLVLVDHVFWWFLYINNIIIICI